MNLILSKKTGVRLAFLSFVMLLVACGGGSLDSDTNSPAAKVIVNAGSNRSVDENTTITLSAEAIGVTEPLRYAWRASPSLVITHEDTSVATASFVTPTTTSILSYILTLEVTDADGNKGSDTVEYQVLPVNIAPSAQIVVNQIQGFALNQFPAGIEVVLDGSTSFDTDASDGSQTVTQFKWQQTAGEEVLGGISTDGDSLAFISPVLDNNNSLSFTLTVTDEEGAQGSASVTLSVLSASNTVPVVNAGVDHQVFSGESIILAGEASTSVAAARPLLYQWLNDSELNPLISDPKQLRTHGVAPKVSSTQTMTFTLAVSDASGNVVEDAVNVVINPLLIRPLNDTGILLQANNSANTTEQQHDFPGQDAQRGQDIIATNGLLEKAGRGDAGFDFTRLDNIGDEVDDSQQTWSCVRDNVTGLIWEVKSAATSTDLHSSAHTYSWYLSEQGDEFSGAQSPTLASCSLTECNTAAYVAAVNSAGLCNFNDWRMPSHQELLSIVHFGRTTPPMIDPDYFPNTADSTLAPAWYWTNQSSADGADSDSSRTAWAVDFNSGNDNFLMKTNVAFIRLVRAGR
ncbi:Lcl domain-containing protein [Flavobacterium sp. W21_SRS_FM6]|uniref:Lcl C-terminal domain-containing protein n=1 Tax=Flavobacterium sp. W21_SRS_FM6 TaxID=3240268 RepID=UPI003F937C19